MRRGYLLLLLLVIAPAQAAVYQWKDENGRVHFSDRPVDENATEKRLKSAPAPSAAPALPEERKQRQQRMLDAYEKERAEKREAKAKQEKEREEQKRKCHTARARYDEYSTAGSIYDYLESGERKYLNREERKSFIDNLKADIARYCK